MSITIMMVQALRRLEGSALLAVFSNLTAYVERGKARPAFKRAFAAQLAVFTGGAPAIIDGPFTRPKR